MIINKKQQSFVGFKKKNYKATKDRCSNFHQAIILFFSFSRDILDAYYKVCLFTL